MRLARSHLADEAFDTVHGRCEGCGQVSDLEVVDARYGFCTLCETTNSLVRMRLADESEIVVTGR